MIIENKPTTVSTSQSFKEFSFGIKDADMGLVLEILRSKLYSNPIGAICREIASNSRDANRESENNVPIEIAINHSALSASDMTISFKDFGPGISPERMADVFVNYGSSTKRESDTYTGGFGLGAKTPFSYADNFTIETIVAGIKYTYVAAIEEGRKGKIYCIDSAESTENSGTTIIIPIKEQDRREFEREVYKATAFWPMRPIYKNFSRKFDTIVLKPVLDDENFLIIEQDLLNSGYGLLLDGIYYPISTSAMNFANYYVSDFLIIFKFNVGELTISANRETLQYDDKTKTAINKRFVELVNLCKSNYEALYKQNQSWIDAAIFNHYRDSNIWFKIIKQQLTSNDPFFSTISKFDERSLKLRLDEHFQTLQFFNVEIDRGKVSRTRTTDVSKKLTTTPIFLFDQTSSYIPLKDATIFSKHEEYIAIRPTDPKFLRYSELAYKEKRGLAKSMRRYLHDVELLGKLGIAYSLYSSVDKMKIVKDASGATPKVPFTRPTDTLKVYVQTISDQQYTKRSGQSRPGSYVYVKVTDTQVTTESGSPLKPENTAVCFVDDILVLPDTNTEEMNMYRYAVKAGLLPDFRIIYANKNRGAKLVNFFGSIKDKLDALTPAIITKMIDGAKIHSILSERKWLLNIPFKSKKFSDMVNVLNSVPAAPVSLPSNLIDKYSGVSQLSNLNADIKELYKMFPLLSIANNYEMSNSSTVTAMAKYIELMETDLIANKKLI
jgi:hypothetical protein